MGPGIAVQFPNKESRVTDGNSWYSLEGGDEQTFDLQRARLEDGPQTTAAVAGFLLEGLADPAYLSNVVRKHGLAALADYIQARRISSKLGIRVADFGEITAGRLLEAEESLHRLIEKLRFRFNHDWSPHLTDIFAVQYDDQGEIAAFSYCEVKAGTTSPASDIAEGAYRDLGKAWRETVPEILHFTAERLWDSGRQDDYERLDRAMASPTMPQLLRLIFVFDDAAWSEDVLDSLGAAIAADPAPGAAFKCYLIRRSELKALIEESYVQMAALATAI